MTCPVQNEIARGGKSLGRALRDRVQNGLVHVQADTGCEGRSAREPRKSPAREQLVRDHTKRIHVDSPVDLLPPCALLGRLVERGSASRIRFDTRHSAESGDHHAIAVHENHFGSEAPMDRALRMLVVERGGNTLEDFDRPIERRGGAGGQK